MSKFEIDPKFIPPLDERFKPAVLANLKFKEVVDASRVGVPLVLAVERVNGAVSHFETEIFPDDHADAGENLWYAERIVKFLLWQRGGWKVYVGGSAAVASYLSKIYSKEGERSFDWQFMGDIYQHEFSVVACDVADVPAEKEIEKELGRHLKGNRIGFDLGASDLKVSAVVDGEAIFSTEIEWQPVQQTDPAYHRAKIKSALELAASKMSKLDAIGGSSAGVHINNQPMVASLYRGIPEEHFDQIRTMFRDFSNEMGVPLVIVNDGEVTALAGSMSLEGNAVLGIAMGSSEAAGYVNEKGLITDWLNELAFAPVDYQEDAPLDEWSGDVGNGALYFSQQCVFRLAPRVGIEVPADLPDAQRLKFVQVLLEEGDAGAALIWESMGVYLGYTIAHYADFYQIKHVLILGRCTSGKGGTIILEKAKEVLGGEFPVLAEKINIQLPDEKSRRVGQSIAAASLPELKE